MAEYLVSEGYGPERGQEVKERVGGYLKARNGEVRVMGKCGERNTVKKGDIGG